MRSMRSWWAGAAVVLSLLLSGCATPLRGQLTAFHEWPADAPRSECRFMLAIEGVEPAQQAVIERGGASLSLPVNGRIAVAVYIGVIVLMAAQAWGRWTVLRSRAALQVAIGASLFMLSDSILAIDRFVQPVDFALFWVLITYFAAQVLILCGLTAPSNTANHAGKH